MEELPLFNINLCKFTCDDALTDKILEVVKQIDWRHNMSNKISDDDLFFHPELFDWFDECILTVKKKIGIPDSVDLPITSCWANKTEKLNAHHFHSHSNSVMSGIFYLTSHLSGETRFTTTNYWVKDITPFMFMNPLPENIHAKILPVKSTLILFPSHIQHSVMALKQVETRYTISFNTYLTGEIQDGKNKCRLDLKSKSVRDWHNET